MERAGHDTGREREEPGDAARGWSHFEHEADIGLLGWAPTLEGAFEEAALALTGVVTEPGAVRSLERRRVVCEAPDPETLLADWLNALIFEMSAGRLLPGEFSVRISPGEPPLGPWRLEGEAWGEPVDRARHEPAVEPKGVTYTALAVRRRPDGLWEARAVVDV